MTSPIITDAITPGVPFFGPGFTGGSWVSGAEPVDSFILPTCAAQTVPQDLFQRIAAYCADIPVDGFVGGYVGYEASAALMPDLVLPEAPDGLPVVHLVKYARREEVSAPAPRYGDVEAVSLPAIGARDYKLKVQAVIDAVLDGEIFQANISRRLSAELARQEGLAEQLFARLIAEGPAPYAAFLPVQGGAVMSNSPELFLSVDGGLVAAEPVKGTAPRAADPVTDRNLADALRHSEKDRAENIMIADLLRNDLAKVCVDHSISEPFICELRS
ncbi:MAG: chorismate-binding protein, partial [Pseudomonadota bacterium]